MIHKLDSCKVKIASEVNVSVVLISLTSLMPLKELMHGCE
jgi:hypothetical protein